MSARLHTYPASIGLLWAWKGVQVFWRYPFGACAAFVMVSMPVTLVSSLPLVGSVLALALLPLVSLFMMVLAVEITKGNPNPMPFMNAVFLVVVRQRCKALATLGILYAAGFVAAMGLSALMDGGQFAQLWLGGQQRLTSEMVQSADFQAAMWLALLLYVPLTVTFWHAPGLVYWLDVPPLKALFFSIVACMRNWKAFVVYTLVWLGVLLGTGAVLGLTIQELNAAGLGGVGAIVLIVAGVMLSAMFLLSVVYTVHSCFDAGDESEQANPSH